MKELKELMLEIRGYLYQKIDELNRMEKKLNKENDSQPGSKE